MFGALSSTVSPVVKLKM